MVGRVIGPIDDLIYRDVRPVSLIHFAPERKHMFAFRSVRNLKDESMEQ